jgi:hypothetical protein
MKKSVSIPSFIPPPPPNLFSSLFSLLSLALLTFGHRREYVGGSSGSIQGTIQERRTDEAEAEADAEEETGALTSTAAVCFLSPNGEGGGEVVRAPEAVVKTGRVDRGGTEEEGAVDEAIEFEEVVMFAERAIEVAEAETGEEPTEERREGTEKRERRRRKR